MAPSMKGTIMSGFTRLAATAAILAASIAIMAKPSAAKQRHEPVRAPYAWQEIDRNGDGDISRKEWNWAEKKGYDRLSRHGGHVTRKVYQAQLNRYLDYLRWRQLRADRYSEGRYSEGRYDDGRYGNRWDDNWLYQDDRRWPGAPDHR
jgi:hypothetical protein